MQEYLNNPIIEDVKYYITNDKIEIKNKLERIQSDFKQNYDYMKIFL